MAPIEADQLRTRALRAYERGRLRWALARALCVLPLLLAALAPMQRPGGIALRVALLFAAVAALSFHGRTPGRTVFPALLAGLVPMAAPLAVCMFGHACGSAQCMSYCLPACCAGGLVAGALVAVRARAEPEGERRLFLATACVLVAFTGAIGCTAAGAAGVVGMFAATVLASAPALRTTA